MNISFTDKQYAALKDILEDEIASRKSSLDDFTEDLEYYDVLEFTKQRIKDAEELFALLG